MSGVLAPLTAQFFDRVGSMEGWTVVDAGCGSGDVAFDLAQRVGPAGRVFGLDMDGAQLSIVRAEAQRRGIQNIEFAAADVRSPWPVPRADLAYVRFVLTHLADPSTALKHASAALKPGGLLLLEDVDMAGHSCHPPSLAFDTYYRSYIEAAKLQGGDPFVGLRLDLLLEEAGFAEVEVALVQAFGRSGDVKLIPELTMAALGGGLVEAGLVDQQDVNQTVAELRAFCERADTTVFMPRVFQVRGRRAHEHHT
jgi:SAM-dependent methyltransferase